MQTAWLIEFKESVSQQPAWYGADDTEGLGMVTDVNQAIRFCRKWDADQVITEIGWTEAAAVEIAWIDGNPCRPVRLRTRNPLPSGVSDPSGRKPKQQD